MLCAHSFFCVAAVELLYNYWDFIFMHNFCFSSLPIHSYYSICTVKSICNIVFFSLGFAETVFNTWSRNEFETNTKLKRCDNNKFKQWNKNASLTKISIDRAVLVINKSAVCNSVHGFNFLFVVDQYFHSICRSFLSSFSVMFCLIFFSCA